MRASTGFDTTWAVPDEQVRAGRYPGYVAAVRLHADLHVRGRRRDGNRCGQPTADRRHGWLLRLAPGVDLEAAEPWMSPGRWGWTGGTGTTVYVDPVRDTVAVLLTRRAMTGPPDGFGDFFAAVAVAA